jgi:hypothetical protein
MSASVDPGAEPREVIAGFKWMLVPFVVLAVGATAALYVRTTHTEDEFSWTIAPELTAALLGAAYAGTLVFFLLALRERVWANFRMVIPAPFVLSTLLLVATLVHLDKFHLDRDPLPATIAWIWLVVYLIVPPGLVFLTVAQLRTPGVDPPRTRPLPVGLRLVVLLYGVAGVVGGLMLFVTPGSLVPHWPWTITPLTGRALAAWLAGLGVAALQAVWENDVRRVRIGMAALIVVGAFGLVAVLRYSDDVTSWWPGGWVLVGVLGVMTAIGGYGLVTERRGSPADA